MLQTIVPFSFHYRQIEASEKYLFEPQSVKFIPAPSDEKMTPHLMKKKYWEDKARDLRDDNDNMCAVNDSLIRTRIPSAGIYEQDYNINPKNKRILRYGFRLLFFILILLHLVFYNL